MYPIYLSKYLDSLRWYRLLSDSRILWTWWRSGDTVSWDLTTCSLFESTDVSEELAVSILSYCHAWKGKQQLLKEFWYPSARLQCVTYKKTLIFVTLFCWVVTIVTLWIVEFLAFAHSLVFWENISFRKLDLFPSSWQKVGRNLFRWILYTGAH
jgi:hypothetical protein